MSNQNYYKAYPDAVTYFKTLIGLPYSTTITSKNYINVSFYMSHKFESLIPQIFIKFSLLHDLLLFSIESVHLF